MGTERDGPRRDHGNIGSVWTSEDGLVWRRSARGVGPYLQHVIEHEGHLYAVGGSVANRDQGGIWASDDATAWEQVHAAPVSVIASDGETIVAGTEDAMSWSTDGRAWMSAPIEAGGADAWLEDATAFDDGFLAVGARDDDGAVWHSVDGRSWTAEPETLDTGAHITHLNAVAPLPTDGVLIAAGTNELTSLLYRYEVGEPWGEPILAVDGSDDGGEWPFTDAVVADGRTLIVGQGTDAPRRFSAAAWTTPPPGAFAAPGHAITACPGPRPTIDELVVMDAAARLACFGDQELTFRAWLAPHETADPEYFGRPQWLTAGAGGLRALPVAGSPSASMYLVLHMRPRDDARPGRPASRWAAVTGHFGDRASRT